MRAERNSQDKIDSARFIGQTWLKIFGEGMKNFFKKQDWSINKLY